MFQSFNIELAVSPGSDWYKNERLKLFSMQIRKDNTCPILVHFRETIIGKKGRTGSGVKKSEAT